MPLTVRNLDDGLAVAPQISVSDISEAARLGYKVIINNRPDGEEPGQLAAAEARAAAEANGLTYIHLPVDASTMGPEMAGRFAEALNGHGGPVLAHCRSGTRSTHLWAMAAAMSGARPVAEIVSRAGAAGYDLAALRPTLDRLAAKD